MRLFLTTSNLHKSAALAALVTLMSIGRIVQGNLPLDWCIPSVFLLLMFIAGAVIAWGQCAGMPGIVTSRPTFLRGLLIVCILLLPILPIQVFWLDPAMKSALLTAGRPDLLALAYPGTLAGQVSLLFWSAGFQTLFMVAAPMALVARIAGRWPVALVACLFLRAYIGHLQISDYGLAGHALLFTAATVPAIAIACCLFARFGLVPAMLFNAGLDLHSFLTGHVCSTFGAHCHDSAI